MQKGDNIGKQMPWWRYKTMWNFEEEHVIQSAQFEVNK
jgi:hypothetical protein